MSEVYKGEVAAIQEVVSEVSGASCGLEIPREGEFLVFGTKQGFAIEVGEGQCYSGLCGGTRSTSDGPLAVDVVPSLPEPAQETTSTTIGERDLQTAADSTRPAANPQDEKSKHPTIVVVGVAFALAVVGAAILTRRRVGGARS